MQLLPAYENEAAEIIKPHAFVLDFVGIFDKSEKAWAFDSDEIKAIVEDMGLLKWILQFHETSSPTSPETGAWALLPSICGSRIP
jgi:hypothetical protein